MYNSLWFLTSTCMVNIFYVDSNYSKVYKLITWSSHLKFKFVVMNTPRQRPDTFIAHNSLKYDYSAIWKQLINMHNYQTNSVHKNVHRSTDIHTDLWTDKHDCYIVYYYLVANRVIPWLLYIDFIKIIAIIYFISIKLVEKMIT